MSQKDDAFGRAGRLALEYDFTVRFDRHSSGRWGGR